MKKYIFYISLLWFLFSGCESQLKIDPQEVLTFYNVHLKREMQSLIYENHKNFNTPKGLSLSNAIIEMVDKVEDADQEWKDIQKGEAFFCKAYTYFFLVNSYGDYVLIKDKPITDAIAKSTWTEIVDYAIECAEKAVELLPWVRTDRNFRQMFSPVNAENFFYVSKGAAYAILAKLYALKAGWKWLAVTGFDNYDPKEYWKKAEAACSEIINSGHYRLAPLNEVKECWTNRWKEENIFVLIKFQVDRERRSVEYVNDILKPQLHRDAYLNVLQLKFLMIPGRPPVPLYMASPHPESFPFFIMTELRLSDIILLRAEVRERLGNTQGAISDLNAIRTRVELPLYSDSEGSLQEAIFYEKNHENLFYTAKSMHPQLISVVTRISNIHDVWTDFISMGKDFVQKNLVQIFVRTRFFPIFINNVSDLTEQDYIDGVLFTPLPAELFKDNVLLRQNTFWHPRLPRHYYK